MNIIMQHPQLDMIKIVKLEPWDFTPLAHWLELAGEPVGMTKADMLGRIMLKKYVTLIAKGENNIYGCAVLELIGTTCNVIYAAAKPPGMFKGLLKRFKEDIRQHGYKTLRAWTRHDPKVFERLTGMKTVWSCLEEKLT